MKDLQSFLGLVNYLTRFSRKLATLTTPLQELTKKEIAHVWDPDHDQALRTVKKELGLAPIFQYFEERDETTIQADASRKGHGSILLQNGQPICHATKALTRAECNYSNIEYSSVGCRAIPLFHLRKALHHKYRPQTIRSYFQKKKLSNCPPRLQRLLLRALRYDVTVTYLKGKNVLIADGLSRITPQK